MSDKVFGCLFERTDAKMNLAVNFLAELKTKLIKEGRIDLVNEIDNCLENIRVI